MKKKIAILTLVFYLFTSVIVQPQQKTHAFAFAIPAGTGAIALGALALGGIAAYVGLETYGEDISDWGSKVWDKTTQTTKDALNSVTTWIQDTSTPSAVPDVKIDYGALSSDVRATLESKSLSVQTNAISSDYEQSYLDTTDAVEFENLDGVKVYTKYPEINAHMIGSVNVDIMSTDANTLFLLQNVVTGEIYVGDRLRSSNGYVDIYNAYDLSEPLVMNDTFRIRYGTSFSSDNAPTGIKDFRKAWSSLYRPYEDLSAVYADMVNTVGIYYTVISKELADDLRSASYGSSISEAWESMKDAGLVIDGNAILEANPGITWDGQSFVDGTGVAVPTDSLTMPRLGIKDGVIGYPLGESWADVGTGTAVGDGTAPPGEGTAPGETDGGILQGLWDWLKGILQQILDAIKALANLLGITALIEAIKSLVSSIADGVASIAETITTGLVGKAENVKWDRLKQAGAYFTTKFPFSLPWDVGRALTAVFGQFDSQNVPSWEFTIYGETFKISLPKMMVDWFPVTRTMILVAFDIGLLYSVRKLLGVLVNVSQYFNGLIEVLYAVAWALTALLPNTPFDFSGMSWGVLGDAIGIVFPVSAMGIHMTVILGAFAVYYAIRWLLRIIRQVQ